MTVVPLPYVEFTHSVQVLSTEDIKSLRNELFTLASDSLDHRTNEGSPWVGHVGALISYGMHLCTAYQSRTGKPDEVLDQFVALQYVLGKSASTWMCPKWMLTDEYLQASRCHLLEGDQFAYNEMDGFADINQHIPFPAMTAGTIKPYSTKAESEGPYCECQNGSLVHRIANEAGTWWLCSRCDRTIEMWHRASRHTSFHTFQGGVLDGQEMTSHDLQDHPEWADYTIVEASEEDMFSINPMFVWEAA